MTSDKNRVRVWAARPHLPTEIPRGVGGGGGGWETNAHKHDNSHYVFIANNIIYIKAFYINICIILPMIVLEIQKYDRFLKKMNLDLL